MKRINTIILPLLAAASLSSCSKQATPDSNFPEDRVIRVQASVLPSTKGSYTTADFSEFGLTVKNTDYSASGIYNYDNVVFQKNSDGWAPESVTPLWRNATDNVIMVATVPQNADNSSMLALPGKLFTIQTVQSKDDNSSDILGWASSGKPTDLLENGKVKIEFQHLMSKLNLTFELSSEFNFSEIPDDDIVSNVVIEGTYSQVRIYYDKNNDRFGFNGASPNPTDISAYNTGWTKAASKEEHCKSQWECILVKGTYSGITISFNVNGKPYICTLSGKTLEQGKAHNLTINVGKDVATVGPMTIAGWVESGSNSNLETE